MADGDIAVEFSEIAQELTEEILLCKEMSLFLSKEIRPTPQKSTLDEENMQKPSMNRDRNIDVGLEPHSSGRSMYSTPRLFTIPEITEPPTSEAFKRQNRLPFGDKPFEFHWRRDGENRPHMDSGSSSDIKPVPQPKLKDLETKKISSRQRAMDYRGHIALNHDIQWIGQPKAAPTQASDKDPLKWDSPSPQKEKRKVKTNPVPAETVGPLQKRPPRLANASQIGSSIGKAGQTKPGETRNRDYERPWRVEKKPEKGAGKNRADDSEFLKQVYPDGDGPDANLIKMLEREVIDRQLDVTFDDIAALDEAKKIIQESVLLPLLMPQYFIGIRKPRKGVLLFGPPGTGKTMLAKALASKGQTTFFNVNASTLASKWKGDSEKLVRVLSCKLAFV